MLKDSLTEGFRREAKEKELCVYGIHIFRNGEELTCRWRSDDEVCLYSGSKTFVSVGCGIAQDEGLLDIRSPWLDYFPELREKAAPGTEKQTLRDLLQMSSGKRDPLDGIGRRSYDGDLLELWAGTDCVKEPGTEFHYTNLCTYTLGRVITRVSGQELRDYLMPRLFLPMGIVNPQWHTDRRGHTLGFSGLFLHTEEFARLGRLLLQRGRWEDRQLVSEEYVRALQEDIVDTSRCRDPESAAGYGYQVWKCSYPGAFRADGMYGQFSIVFPDRDAVVTVTAHNESQPNDIIRAILTEILPQL